MEESGAEFVDGRFTLAFFKRKAAPSDTAGKLFSAGGAEDISRRRSVASGTRQAL
jgi:hypothetical protein